MVAGEYPPMQGGLGDFTRCLASALAGQGCEVSVLAPRGCTSGDPAVTVLPLARGWGWRDLTAVARRAAECDVVNLQYQAAAYHMRPPIHMLPVALGRRASRLVTTFHDLRVPYLFPKAGRLRGAAVRQLLRRSGAAIVTNEEDLAEAGAVVRRAALHLVRIGSNVAPEAPDPAASDTIRRRWGCGEGTTVLSYFGFQNASKGSLDLVQAMGMLVAKGRDLRLVFVGGETGASDASNRAYAERVRRGIAGMGLDSRVVFTGWAPPAQVSQMLYASDMTVLPYRDGASFRRGSLMAALAHGMAIVTTRPALPVAGLSDGDNVLLVPPADVPALAAAIERLVGDSALRADLGRRARSLAAAFTWEAIARDTLAVYRSLTPADRASAREGSA